MIMAAAAQKGVNWSNVGMGVGIAALGVGVGYGLYRYIGGRAGYSDLENTAKRIRDDMIKKEERLAAATDPELRAAILEDYEREGRALCEVVVPKMAEIAGQDELSIMEALGIGIIVYLAFRGAPYIAQAIKRLREVKPALQPSAYDAVLTGMMPDQLAAIGMTSADIGLTDYAIYEAQRQLGVVPPAMYQVSDKLAASISNCMISYMAGAPIATIGAVSASVAASAIASYAVYGTLAAAGVCVAGAAITSGALITVLQAIGTIKLFFGC